MKNERKIGLSLSGGGYRATIYHLGTLRKLKEMELLDKVDVISTISGGSITGAYYGLKGNDFEAFDKGLVQIVRKSIIRGIYFSFRFICIITAMLSIIGKNGQIDHLFSEQIDHQFRSKLTTTFQFKLTTSFGAN